MHSSRRYQICICSVILVACVAGVRKGRGRELGHEPTCSRAPNFLLPLLTPATQAIILGKSSLFEITRDSVLFSRKF